MGRQPIESPLAKRILNGDFGPGDAVEVDVGGDGLVFTKSVGADAKAQEEDGR